MILDFQKNGAVVLTTQEQGAFLNFNYDPAEAGSTFYIIPEMVTDISIGILYVNGMDISSDANKYAFEDVRSFLAINKESGNEPSRASIFVSTKEVSNFDISLNINIYRDGTEPGDFEETISIQVLNRPYIVSSESVNNYDSTNVQVDGDTSHLVLRTNPKYGGNIKLVVDSSDNLYLDTFKSSDILSNKLYRKQKVSSKGVLSGDIRNVFSNLPQGEMYKLDDEDTLDISIPKTDLFNQYNTNYSYGSRLLEDELYDESNAILAPLWINNKIPDYFAVFSMPGVLNEESYDTEDLSKLANKFISEGEIVKSWGMKENSPLGEYLQSHLSELTDIVSPTFLSLSDPGLRDPDPNTWYGIAIDKGIITGRSETTYFFDQKSDNFTNLNAFTSNGFERLNLLCPNLINLEFAFNDTKAELYSMQRYFGLYLTENPLYEISYYADSSSSDIQVISLDDNDPSPFFNSGIFDASGNLLDKFSNRIFSVDDTLSLKRIKNINLYNGSDSSEISEWLNKPGKNILSTHIEEIKDLNPFITINIYNKLSQGEHFRIIDEDNSNIWEIYGVDSDLLEAGESITYATAFEETGYPDIKRTAYSVKGTIEDQNTAMWNAWNVFADYADVPFETLNKRDNDHSIIAKTRNNPLKLQRLTSQTSAGLFDTPEEFNAASSSDDVGFFGSLIPKEDDLERISYNAPYGPINFELFGDRRSFMVDFFDPSGYFVYSMEGEAKLSFNENMLYLSDENWYKLVSNFSIDTNNTNYQLRYSDDPTKDTDKIIIITKHPIVTVNHIWNAYELYPLTISLTGINPVKDFDYTVYDSSVLDFKSDHWYKREGDAETFNLVLDPSENKSITAPNAYEIVEGSGSLEFGSSTYPYNVTIGSSLRFNTFDSSIVINPSTETTVTYGLLDGSTNFVSYVDGHTEENLKDYYLDYNDASTDGFYGASKLKYGLTIPHITKWNGIGNDCRNNPIQLMLDSTILDGSSNFIPTETEFKGEIFYPSFKYLDASSANREDYVYYDINDSIEYRDENNITKYRTFKDTIFDDPYSDIFSKVVYSSPGAIGSGSKSTIVYYNSYKNALDTILNGLSLSFSISESAKNLLNPNDWDKYRISAIAMPSRNRTSNKTMEVFINENTETILIVWYQGFDILNYNFRNSSTTLGKGALNPDIPGITETKFTGFNNSDPRYSHVKTPFSLNAANQTATVFNTYGIDSDYANEIVSPLMQFNTNINSNLSSVFNAWDSNYFVNGSFRYDFKLYQTFNQFIGYTYIKNSSTFGSSVINQCYTYNYNKNLYLDQTCELEVLQYILDNNDIEYYVFRGDKIYNNDTFNVPPIQIKLNDPKEYNGIKVYNGWFSPGFNNILEFSSNEDIEIINTVKKDFTAGNTDLVSHQNIEQLWFNKVVSSVSTEDVSMANSIDYKKDFNPFSSIWDANYYTTYSDSVVAQIDGYNSTLELPSYFGSKLIKLPKEIVLDSWTETTTNTSSNINGIQFEFKLTRSLIQIFKNNDTFINNWSGLNIGDDIIDGYIKKTIINYYNIARSKIGVEIWTKSKTTETSALSLELDDTFTKWSGANVEGNLIFNNNEYTYSLDINNDKNLIYFVKFILFEK